MRNRTVALTLQEVMNAAPSAFAQAAHESRSSRYTFVSTETIIHGMSQAGFEVFQASESRTRKADLSGFAKHMLRFRSVTASLVNVGDSAPEVVLINSHAGQSKYKLLGGIFRLVCGNGMVIAESTFGTVTVRHSGDILENIISGSNRVIEASRNALRNIAEWQRIQLNRDEQMILAESAHQLRFADVDGKVTTPITVAQLLEPRRHEDTSNDLYTTFNRVQENVVRGGLHGVELNNGQRRRVTTRRVTGIDQDVRLNQQLWALADKMAELKK